MTRIPGIRSLDGTYPNCAWEAIPLDSMHFCLGSPAEGYCRRKAIHSADFALPSPTDRQSVVAGRTRNGSTGWRRELNSNTAVTCNYR
jgi:hypothetical protein